MPLISGTRTLAVRMPRCPVQMLSKMLCVPLQEVARHKEGLAPKSL